jgi:acetyl/propionyl-CoA carboxylase alpha subunit
MPGVRVDSGVAEDGEVSVHYDPMLAKVIAAAETREQARVRLVTALRQFPILGVRTNIAFLIGVLEHPRFRVGEIDTAFLDAEGAAIAAQTPNEAPPFVLAAIAAADEQERAPGAGPDALGSVAHPAWDPWVRLKGWRA